MQLATRRAFTIVPEGPFSLREAATFGFGQRLETTWDGVMRLAFCVDGYSEHAGVEVRQDERGVHCIVHGDADVAAVRRQVARVLSLDHDGAAFARIGERDPVMARLLAAAPGLRPPLFYSPYEAAAWAVLSVRRVPKQMDAVRRRLSEAHGATFDLAGERVAAFPTPDQLLVVDAFPGISADRMTRLHGVARAALDGWLDVSRIHKLGPGSGDGRLAAHQRHRPVLQRAHRHPRERLRRRAAARRRRRRSRSPASSTASAARRRASSSPRSRKRGGRIAPGRSC